MITLRLLGPVEARVEGGPAPPKLLWRKNLALLCYLVVAPDRRASREQLAGLLWGDKRESDARHSLAEALRVLRRNRGDGIQDVGSGYVGLVEGVVDADTDRFLARSGAGDPAGAAALVAGEFMQGFAIPDAWEFEEWLAGQRRAWRTRCEDVLVAAAEAALAAGAPDRAHDAARRALDLVWTSDRACQLAMKSLCLRGDRGVALELFEAFAARLDDQLQILPAAETTALAERVRLERRWRLPEPRVAQERRGAESRRAPLVGRSEELMAVIGDWAACRDGGGASAVVLAGDSGTGRTRLLEELVGRARLDGGRVAMVRAVPADQGHAGAVLEALARAGGFAAGVRGFALGDSVRRTTEKAPLLLAVDDAVWADDASLAELAALPTRIPDAAVLVTLVAGRRLSPSPIERLGGALGRDVPGRLLRLEPLGLEALRELAAWGMPDYESEAVDRLARRLAADTGGYPLLAVEVLHALASGLALDDAAEPWPRAGQTLDQTRPGDLPEPLVAAVRVGFRVLRAPAQSAAAAASVLEPPVTADRVAAATGLGGEALAAALDELEWERWLVADARGYAFVARLVREIVARDMVTPGQRQRFLESA